MKDRIENKQRLGLELIPNAEDEEILYCDVCNIQVCVMRYNKKVVHDETPACNKCGCGIDATGLETFVLCMNCRGSST